MQELKEIWAFGLPYLRPYMFRFVAGVVLGMLFGMSNGVFVLSVDSLFTRLTQNSSPAVATPNPAEDPRGLATVKSKVTGWWRENAGPMADRLLPRIGHPMTWLQAVGAFS